MQLGFFSRSSSELLLKVIDEDDENLAQRVGGATTEMN
jgi:hypothetical protein